MIKKFLAALLLAALPSLALAQGAPTSFPPTLTGTVVSGTIATSNTFQNVWAAVPLGGQQRRLGCALQNQGTGNMQVFFGPIASATTSNSFNLAVGATIYCNLGDPVLQNEVNILGALGYHWVGISF